VLEKNAVHPRIVREAQPSCLMVPNAVAPGPSLDGQPEADRCRLRNVQKTWSLEPDFQFELGVAACVETFPAATPGLGTRVRFGVLAPSGEFSGWTEWLEVSYPRTIGDSGPTPQHPDAVPRKPTGELIPPSGSAERELVPPGVLEQPVTTQLRNAARCTYVVQRSEGLDVRGFGLVSLLAGLALLRRRALGTTCQR
jgi:hypothetical protein